MLAVEDLLALEKDGQYGRSRTSALTAVASNNPAERLAGAVFLISTMKFDHFAEALAVLKPLRGQVGGDFATCNLIAYAAWFLNDIELCRWACHRCIALNPAATVGYLRLGMLELLRQGFPDAFCAISAGILNCQDQLPTFLPWFRLAKALTQGIYNTKFSYEGREFTFRLSTFNGHAMETAAQHILGRFCEEAELAYVYKFVGRCESVVEVGAAVGNHSVFFAKMLCPRRINVFDANLPAVEHTRVNLSLNCSDSQGPKAIVHHAAVGAVKGHMRIFDQDVPVVRLDDELKEPVDFIKIDVDGMEMEVLEGCRGLIARDRPKVMIEVQNELKPRFTAFIQEYEYVIEHEIVRPVDTNYFIKPRPGSAGKR